MGILDANGALVVEYKYDAWGKPIAKSTLTTAYDRLADLNPFRYRGYVYDEETGLYYLRSRYYSSLIDRFLNMDAVILSAVFMSSPFAYAYNNPVSFSDSDGKLPETSDVKVYLYAPGDHYSIEIFGVLFSFTADGISAQDPALHPADYIYVFDDVPGDIASAGLKKIVTMCHKESVYTKMTEQKDLYEHLDSQGMLESTKGVYSLYSYKRNSRPCVWMVLEALKEMGLEDSFQTMCGNVIRAEYTAAKRKGNDKSKLKDIRMHYLASEFVERYEIRKGIYHIALF